MGKTKICTKCHKEKNVSEFNKGCYPDGFQYYCRECVAIYSGRYRKEHRKEANEYSGRYRKEHRDEVKEYGNRYRKEHRDEVKEYGNRYRKEHHEELNEYIARFRESHPEKVKEYSAKYRKIHHESIKKSTKKYREAHPDRVRQNGIIQENKRRCRKLQLEGAFTTADIAHLQEVQEGKCLMCGEIKKLTVDHIVPVSKGGRNDITNLQLLCVSCNSKKRATTKDLRSKKLLSRIFKQGELF